VAQVSFGSTAALVRAESGERWMIDLATGRRVTMYRGVFPVMFDVIGCNTAEALYNAIFARLLELELVRQGDLVIVTKGELSGVQGGTNSMQILKVHLT